MTAARSFTEKVPLFLSKSILHFYLTITFPLVLQLCYWTLQIVKTNMPHLCSITNGQA